ncbi:MAG: hypothetical protein IT247_09530, partial [Bacteroidia bacterium]|nr:hypothetical protein [Bacteroidia bacterium]
MKMKPFVCISILIVLSSCEKRVNCTADEIALTIYSCRSADLPVRVFKIVNGKTLYYKTYFALDDELYKTQITDGDYKLISEELMNVCSDSMISFLSQNNQQPDEVGYELIIDWGGQKKTIVTGMESYSSPPFKKIYQTIQAY